MLLLIGEYYGDPRQNFGHSHGAKHVRILPMEVMDAYICCLCWLVRKLWWLKHLKHSFTHLYVQRCWWHRTFVPCFMSLLIGEYYGDPRQSFGHSHGTKHIRILLTEVREE